MTHFLGYTCRPGVTLGSPGSYHLNHSYVNVYSNLAHPSLGCAGWKRKIQQSFSLYSSNPVAASVVFGLVEACLHRVGFLLAFDDHRARLEVDRLLDIHRKRQVVRVDAQDVATCRRRVCANRLEKRGKCSQGQSLELTDLCKPSVNSDNEHREGLANSKRLTNRKERARTHERNVVGCRSHIRNSVNKISCECWSAKHHILQCTSSVIVRMG